MVIVVVVGGLRVQWNIQNHFSIVLVTFVYRLYDHVVASSSFCCFLHFEMLHEVDRLPMDDCCYFVVVMSMMEMKIVWLVEV